MWLAEMDTEHFEFKALGRTKAAATRRLAAAFKLHLKQSGLKFKAWEKATNKKKIEDVYDVASIELVSDGMWCDGQKLSPEDVK
jgi:hypothetical protein